MHIVRVKLWQKYSACQVECPFASECANHTSAGDYRTEDGLTPDLHKVGDHWECSQQPKDHHSGAILITDKVNQLISPEYPSDFDKWWQKTQAYKYTQVVGTLENAFKSVAFEGWVGHKFQRPNKVT